MYTLPFFFLGLPNGDAAQAALQQAYPTIPYPGIGKNPHYNWRFRFYIFEIIHRDALYYQAN